MIDFCLRGLLRHVPWIRQVFLITDHQCPERLAEIQATNPAIPIRVIDHEDFIPARYRPTFNSNAFKSFLHHVPGLSDVVLYLEDDLIFCAPTVREDYIDADGTIAVARGWNDPWEETISRPHEFLRQQVRRARRRLRNALCLALQGLSRDAGNNQYNRMLDDTETLTWSFCRPVNLCPIYGPPHCPTIYLKAGIAFAEQQFPQAIERSRQNRLRSRGDICTSAIALNFARVKGLLRIRPDREAFVRLQADVEAFERALAASMAFPIVCINDDHVGPHAPDAALEARLLAYLSARLPEQAGPQ